MISSINFRTSSLSSDPIAQPKHKVAGVAGASGAHDKVLMSDTARLVMHMIEENQSPEDLDRIMQLQQAVHSGNYEIDPEKVADKLLKYVEEL